MLHNKVYQRNDEALSQLQEVAPQNCILGRRGSLLLDPLQRNKESPSFCRQGWGGEGSADIKQPQQTFKNIMSIKVTCKYVF